MSLLAFFFLAAIPAAHGLMCTNGYAWVSPLDGKVGSHVASAQCLNGRCASFFLMATTFIFEGQIKITSMFCAPEWLLNGTSNGCRDLTGANAATFCVCDTDDCNSGGTETQPADTSLTPILCYEGLVSSAQLVGQTGSHLIPCFGDCYSISVNTTLSFGPFDATLYTCMPRDLYFNLSVPLNLSLPLNSCSALREIEICSCSFSACLDPGEKGAYPEPVPNLECVRGTFVYNVYDEGVQLGGSFEVRVPCPNGMCGNVYTMCNSHTGGFIGQIMVERICAPHELVESIAGRRTGGCAFLDLDEFPLQGSEHAFACFCDNAGGCNTIFGNLPLSTAPRTMSCFSGIGYNDTVPIDSFSQCAGVCSSTTFHQDFPKPDFVTVYSCATVELCSIWNIPMNSCGEVFNEVYACCCNTPNCNQPKVSTATPSPGGCPSGWTRSSVYQKCFLPVTNATTWDVAESTCRSIKRGSSLASVASAFENSEISGIPPISAFYWIGLENVATNNWKWIDNQNLTYTAWANGEPSSSQSCARVQASSRKWSSIACETHLPYVCELFI